MSEGNAGRWVRGTWTQLSRKSKQLVLVGAWLLLVAAGALSLMIWKLHADALAEGRQSVSRLGTAISEQASRSMQAADLVLEELRRQIGLQHPASVDEFKRIVSNEALFRFLKDRSDLLPQVDAYTIIAADGKLANFSRQWPVPNTDLSDRDYVAYFRTHDVSDAFVSAPVQNRGTGGWTVYIVRRVNSPVGEFVGLVLAAIDLDYFSDFFKAVAGTSGTTMTLLRKDGVALTSYPPTAKVGELLPSVSPWYQIIRRGPEVFETKGVLAPGTRIVSVHPLTNYPLVIDVSIGKDTVLVDWQRISLVTLACAILVSLCVAALIRAQLRQFRRLERSEQMILARNVELEGTQERLKLQAEELSAGRAVMAEQSTTLRAALSHMNQGLVVVAPDGTLAVCNGRAAEMLDIPPELAGSRPSFGTLIAYQRSIGEFDRCPSTPCSFGFEEAMLGSRDYERTRPNGLILQVQTVPMEGGGMVRTYTDVTARRRSEMQVQFLASHDALTGLFNRTGFRDRLAVLLAEAADRAQRVAVYYIDLDGFKLVNDTHGHAIGDALLVAIAKRLQGVVRETDIVARMGGDEFVVVQSAIAGPESVSDLANRMLTSVAEPFRFDDTRCSASLSIGVALFPDHATTPEQLLHDADTALYRAKAAGKRTACLFDPALDRGAGSHLLLEDELARALPEGQLYLEYQPIVDAGTLAVVRFEALLRWRHPTRGLVSPGELIGVAERSGLIVPIGLWVVETACAAAASWPWPIDVSVNLSPVQFARGNLASQIEQILQRTGLAPWRLNLEVTEGVLLENTSLVLHAMAAMRQLGIRFSLDDFGTAHAGLTYLRKFSFDVLKIDKSFVQDAAQTLEARGILGAIRSLGTACNLQVVAEGVETEEELAVVRELRCDHVQGYLTGRPSTAVSVDMSALSHLASRGPPRLTII